MQLKNSKIYIHLATAVKFKLNKTFSVYMYFWIPKINIHWLMNLTSIFLTVRNRSFYILLGQGVSGDSKILRIWTRHFQGICIFQLLKSIYTDSWTLPPFFICEKAPFFILLGQGVSGDYNLVKNLTKHFQCISIFEFLKSIYKTVKQQVKKIARGEGHGG
jgi:hypothetical protein